MFKYNLKTSTVSLKRVPSNLYIFKISRIECTGHTVVVAMFAIAFKNVFSSEREYPGLSTILFGVTTYNILYARHSKSWKKYYMNNKFKGTCCVGRGAYGVLFLHMQILWKCNSYFYPSRIIHVGGKQKSMLWMILHSHTFKNYRLTRKMRLHFFYITTIIQFNFDGSYISSKRRWYFISQPRFVNCISW